MTKMTQRNKRILQLRAREMVNLLRDQHVWNAIRSEISQECSNGIVFRDFASYFQDTRKVSEARKELISYALKHILPVVGNMRVDEITENDCIRLIRLLEENLSSGTAHLYYSIFASIMNHAVKREIITCNPTKKIDPTDRIHPIYKERSYLTESELKVVITSYDHDNAIERAFLFGCFCGLRKCDIYRIRWCDIRDDGRGGKLLYIIQKKTKTPLYLPLSKQCCTYLPDRDERASDNAVIFARKYPCQIKPVLRKMMERAGITKDISFHSARHTFATLLLTKGADIYTTSKLLGHTNVKTTAIYAKIVDEKKRQTVDLLNDI